MTLEVVAEACSVGRKKGATKEKEYWIGLGHPESDICRAVRNDLVDVAITVGAPTRCFADAAVVTELQDDSNPADLLFMKSAPFSWADEVSSIPIHSVEPLVSSAPPSRDISCLSSGAQKPFASLQHRSKRNSIRQWRSTGHNRSRYQVSVQRHFTRQSSRSCTIAPSQYLYNASFFVGLVPIGVNVWGSRVATTPKSLSDNGMLRLCQLFNIIS